MKSALLAMSCILSLLVLPAGCSPVAPANGPPPGPSAEPEPCPIFEDLGRWQLVPGPAGMVEATLTSSCLGAPPDALHTAVSGAKATLEVSRALELGGFVGQHHVVLHAELMHPDNLGSLRAEVEDTGISLTAWIDAPPAPGGAVRLEAFPRKGPLAIRFRATSAGTEPYAVDIRKVWIEVDP